ncbi:MAG TPA: GTP 3',8-cyclase MoaA [Firmicutes bacterium]|nr:GTP 3',8-cyclase MoaA [Bacillota bacterium]
MKDPFGREISYLRVAVTDRCNLRCAYCMPPEGVAPRRHDEILRYEEIVRLVGAALPLGIRRIRLTGGEPLVRKDAVDLVRGLAALPGLEEISMTTNGTLLAPVAAQLAEAGLRRVNVSLDSLRPELFRRLTRGGDLRRVLAGIEAALAAGLVPVKLNTVVMAGVNDDEVPDLARMTLTRDVHLRFIEFMALGASAGRGGYVPNQRLWERLQPLIEETGGLEEASVPGSGPARTWRLRGARGTFGFISPVSDKFCDRCNRLRLTADGFLRPCLLSTREVDVKGPLRAGASDPELAGLFRQAVALKPAEQEFPQVGPGLCGGTPAQAEAYGESCGVRYMSQIGG